MLRKYCDVEAIFYIYQTWNMVYAMPAFVLLQLAFYSLKEANSSDEIKWEEISPALYLFITWIPSFVKLSLQAVLPSSLWTKWIAIIFWRTYKCKLFYGCFVVLPLKTQLPYFSES